MSKMICQSNSIEELESSVQTCQIFHAFSWQTTSRTDALLNVWGDAAGHHI
jgi:hypothetical protein